MIAAAKRQVFSTKSHEFHAKNDGFHATNDEIHAKNDALHTKTDGICTKAARLYTKTNGFILNIMGRYFRVRVLVRSRAGRNIGICYIIIIIITMLL